MIRIASFNVENLFARPKVFDLSDWNAGEPVLKAYEKVSALLQKRRYSATDKIRIRDLLVALDIYAVDKKTKAIRRNQKFSRYRLLFANSVRRARERDCRQVLGHKRARPPAALTWFRETVAIPICANKFWRRIGEWVVRKQPKDSLFVFEHSLDKREEPRVQVRRRHGSEPHLPVELPMIRRDDARRTVHVAGFSLELVFAPFR
jgi:hypothetical protein